MWRHAALQHTARITRFPSRWSCSCMVPTAFSLSYHVHSSSSGSATCTRPTCGGVAVRMWLQHPACNTVASFIFASCSVLTCRGFSLLQEHAKRPRVFIFHPVDFPSSAHDKLTQQLWECIDPHSDQAVLSRLPSTPSLRLHEQEGSSSTPLLSCTDANSSTADLIPGDSSIH